MGVLAKSNKQLIYIYSEDSVFGKKLLPYVESMQKPTRVININKEKISDTVWMEIVGMLKRPFREMLSKEYLNTMNSLENKDFNENDWLKIINHYPKLLQKPIAINGYKARVINNRSGIFEFFDIEGTNFDKTPQAIKHANHNRAFKNVS